MTDKIEIVVTMDSSKAEQGASKLTRTLGGLAKIAGGLLAGATAIGLAGIVALGTGLGFAISEAMEAQVVLAQTNAVIASTGGIAGVSAGELARWSGELALVTQFSDDMVQSAGNMLLTFTNINESIFPQTLSLTADLAQAWGVDLNQAAIMVGKALNDPIAGLGSLSRVGIQFTEDQKLMIQSMVESGDLMGAQAVLMEELTRQVGGSAEAFGQTLPGQLAIAKNSIAELAETIGTGLVSVMSGPLGTAFTFISGLVTKATEFFEKFFYAIGQGFTPLEAVQIALGGLIPPELQGMADQVFASLTQIAVVVSQPEFQAALTNVGEALKDLVDAGIVGSMNLLGVSFKSFADFIEAAGPAIVEILNSIAAALQLIASITDGSLGATVGALASAKGANFASFLGIPGFASGGYLPEGQLGIAGEDGPEFLVGGRGGTTIIPPGEGGMGEKKEYQFYGNLSFVAENNATLTGLYEQARAAAGFD